MNDKHSIIINHLNNSKYLFITGKSLQHNGKL